MNAFLISSVGFALLVLAAPPEPGAGGDPAQVSAGADPAPRDGQHDFDYSIGAWRTEVRVRAPLRGSDAWHEYVGTSLVRPIWGGRANMVELDVTGPAGRIVGLSLRLYDPASRLWRLHYANSRNGELGRPVAGAFAGGRGEFTGTETLDGREVLVRFVISRTGPTEWRYEQSFSGDGGESWEANWIAIDTLISRDTD